MDIEGRSDMSQVEYVETPEKEGAWDAEWEGPSRELLQELWKSARARQVQGSRTSSLSS